MNLVYTKENQKGNSIFYRYECGGYQIWFEQHQDDGKDNRHQNCVGCIFWVGISPLNKEDSLPNLNIYDRIGENKGYPNLYEYEHKNYRLNLEDMDECVKHIKRAKLVLASIKHYLENSFHYELFKKREQLKE